MTRIRTMCIVALLTASVAPAVSSKERFVIDFENVEQGHWLTSIDGDNFHIFTRPEEHALTTNLKGVVGGTIKSPYLAIEGRKKIFETAFTFPDRPASLSLEYAFNIRTSEVGRYSLRCNYSDGTDKVLNIDISSSSPPPSTFTCEARGQALINEFFVSIPARADAPDVIYIDNIIGN